MAVEVALRSRPRKIHSIVFLDGDNKVGELRRYVLSELGKDIAGHIEGRAFEEKKLGTELNGYNRWFCGAGISKRAVPLSGGGTAM